MPSNPLPYYAIPNARLASLASDVAAGLPLRQTADTGVERPIAAPRVVHGRMPEVVLSEAVDRARSAEIPVGSHQWRRIGPGQHVVIVIDRILDGVRAAAGLGPDWIESETVGLVARFGEAVASIFVLPWSDGTWLLRVVLVPVDASMRASVLVNAYHARPNRAPETRTRVSPKFGSRTLHRGVALGTTRAMPVGDVRDRDVAPRAPIRTPDRIGDAANMLPKRGVGIFDDDLVAHVVPPMAERPHDLAPVGSVRNGEVVDRCGREASDPARSGVVGTCLSRLDRLDTRLLHRRDRRREKAFSERGMALFVPWLGILPPQPT